MFIAADLYNHKHFLKKYKNPSQKQNEHLPSTPPDPEVSMQSDLLFCV